LELHLREARDTLRLVFEVVKRAPSNCPSRAVAIGASALFVVASTVVAHMAISRIEQAHKVEPQHLCQQCGVRRQCKQSRAA